MDSLKNFLFSQDVPPEKKAETDWQDVLNADYVGAEPGCVQVNPSQAEVPTFASIPQGYDAFVLDRLLTREECANLIGRSEQQELGYGKTNFPKKYRGNLRLIAVDKGLAAKAWCRLMKWVPPTVIDNHGCRWEAVGLNECWRLAKYFPGDVFQSHIDASFQKNSNERSMYTVNIYMNDEFEGGSTRFYKSSDEKHVDFACKPKTGLCVIFRQPPGAYYLHDGEKLHNGIKYLLRTDVMYKRIKELM